MANKELNEIKRILQDRRIKHSNFEEGYKVGFNQAIDLSLMLINDANVGKGFAPIPRQDI